MSRRLALAALAVAALPAAALAQAWPGGSVVTAATVRLPAPQRPTIPGWTPVPAQPASDQAAPALPLKLKARTALVASDEAPTPPVELRAKSEWTDDTGFRASPTKLSYKLRF